MPFYVNFKISGIILYHLKIKNHKLFYSESEDGIKTTVELQTYQASNHGFSCFHDINVIATQLFCI